MSFTITGRNKRVEVEVQAINLKNALEEAAEMRKRGATSVSIHTRF